MRIIDRYIGKQLIVAILLVLIALLGVDIFFYFANELRSVGKGDYTVWRAVVFVALTIPRKIYLIFPWAALLGSLLALGNLAKNHELVVFRAAGISVARVSWAALKAAGLLTVIMFINGEILSPYAEAYAQRKKSLALSRGQMIQTESGTWVRHGDQFIHVGAVLDKQAKSLQDVTRYEFSQNLELTQVLHAQQAQQQDAGWELRDVEGTKFNGQNGEVQHSAVVVQGSILALSELLDPEILQASAVKHLERLTLFNLWRVIKSRVAQELNAIEYQRAFWLKIVQPFAALIMVFLAVPFAFGPLRSASMGLKVLVGILVGFSFHTLNSVFGPLTEVINLSPLLAAIIPSTLFLVLGWWMLQRVR